MPIAQMLQLGLLQDGDLLRFLKVLPHCSQHSDCSSLNNRVLLHDVPAAAILLMLFS